MNTQKAFTLVELLCVVSLFGILAALTMPALQGSKAPQLSTSGARLSGLMEASRQTAIVTRQPVVVAMLVANTQTPQRFTTLQWVPSTSGDTGNWKQISKWEALPSGLLADDTDSDGNPLEVFQPAKSPQLASSRQLPDLVYGGADYKPGVSGGYGYIIFLPDGSLYQDDSSPSLPWVLRIVEASKTASGNIAYQGARNSVGRPANFFEIVLNATGQPKIVRP
ncbi:MAG: Tfp pilus assembly protein FimT/FimU [Chthoniobacteraceae bacterium]